MQKWEYCAISGIYENNGDFNSRSASFWEFSIGGIQESGFEQPARNKVAKKIAELGEQGWEMVGAINEVNYQHCIYFKRPKE